MEFIISLTIWVLLPFLFFTILAIILGQILKLLGFTPADDWRDYKSEIGKDDIWNDPTAYQVGGNLYHHDRSKDAF